jgi:hypothetical protein
VVIVLSFFHVDVWKVVLPFAGGKFIFDICWDHYRYSSDRIPKFNETKPDDVESAEDKIKSALRRGTEPDNMRPRKTMSAFELPNPRGTDATLKSSTPTLHNLADSTTLTENSANTILSLQRVESPQGPPTSASPIPSEVANTVPSLQRVESPQGSPTSASPTPSKVPKLRRRLQLKYKKLAAHFPTFFTALPRLPFGLIPFAFSQFILIEALEHQGWINIFARWLVIASNKQMMPVVWLVGVFGVILCNVSGTNIGATILLTKIIRASDFSESTARAAAVSLAVASNIGAVSFTFSASLAGLLWVAILKDKKIQFNQWKFAMWNTLPLFAMTGVGLGVVSAMMAVLY